MTFFVFPGEDEPSLAEVEEARGINLNPTNLARFLPFPPLTRLDPPPFAEVEEEEELCNNTRLSLSPCPSAQTPSTIDTPPPCTPRPWSLPSSTVEAGETLPMSLPSDPLPSPLEDEEEGLAAGTPLNRKGSPAPPGKA